MNARLMSILVIASMATIPAIAKLGGQANSQATDSLKQALGAVAATANAQGPKAAEDFNAKTNDKSRGAANANPGAVLKVCSKDTPAAHRAAICQTGVSPD